jgi:hypothetical protein
MDMEKGPLSYRFDKISGNTAGQRKSQIAMGVLLAADGMPFQSIEKAPRRCEVLSIKRSL